jgi:hypothetical protein
MDLLHEETLAGMKSQYTVTMVAVAVLTYMVSVSLVLFVDRRKIKPFILHRLSSIIPASLFSKKNNPATNNSGGAEKQAEDQNSKAKPWSSFWASSSLNVRHRRKDKGKAVEIDLTGEPQPKVDV